jgi:hypothetical protein
LQGQRKKYGHNGGQSTPATAPSSHRLNRSHITKFVDSAFTDGKDI